MEAQELREKLTEYIKIADEKKIAAIYTLVEEEIENEYKWWDDEGLVAELVEERRKIESGEMKTHTQEEVFAEIYKRLEEKETVHV